MRNKRGNSHWLAFLLEAVTSDPKKDKSGNSNFFCSALGDAPSRNVLPSTTMPQSVLAGGISVAIRIGLRLQ